MKKYEIQNKINMKGLIYMKSNLLINANDDMTRLEHNILNFALTKLYNRVCSGTEKTPRVEVKITSKEIMQYVMENKSHNNYEELKQLPERLISRVILIEKRKQKRFHKIKMIKQCTYTNGVLTIVFCKAIIPYIIKNEKILFSTIDYLAIKDMKSVNSIKIYEILCQMSNSMIGEEKKFTMDIVELRFVLGFIRFNKKVIEIFNKNYCDWTTIERKLDKLERKMKNRNKQAIYKYAQYKELKRCVLEVARKEIYKNAQAGNCDYYFDYRPMKRIGRKIIEIEFIIHKVKS